MIEEFVPIARAWLGLKNLKIFSFGPRPQDFYACNAPIKPLFDLGVEIMENSELDLYDVYLKAAGSPEIKAVAADMARELGTGNNYPELLDKLAQYEVALLNFMEKISGLRNTVFLLINAGQLLNLISALSLAMSTRVWQLVGFPLPARLTFTAH